MEYDFLIVGAGIIGLAIGRELKRLFPDAQIKIIEKYARNTVEKLGSYRELLQVR